MYSPVMRRSMRRLPRTPDGSPSIGHRRVQQVLSDDPLKACFTPGFALLTLTLSGNCMMARELPNTVKAADVVEVDERSSCRRFVTIVYYTL
ncbi:unnamed protein product [Nippostrongylus brasiliensis]|uniref:Uncharacterized protein n=1 Tax=Nippostrongylus brasiliensis TaxID=27835 RepID=A0A0N4Y3L6_NIPBR|nr:hypothetical protein Q1695_009660 [Nippostrongylus brasiliensis]VDL74003.1 unnamed protein product [Nippostrongylus brasiliensis]